MVHRLILLAVCLVGASSLQAALVTATLHGGTDLIEWEDTGAQAYFLQVGNTAGGSEYFGGDVTGTQQAVAGLPQGGALVYVTLWEQSKNGRWVNDQYTLISEDQATSGSTDSAVMEALFFATPDDVRQAFVLGFSLPLLGYIVSWGYGVVIRFIEQN